MSNGDISQVLSSTYVIPLVEHGSTEFGARSRLDTFRGLQFVIAFIPPNLVNDLKGEWKQTEPVAQMIDAQSRDTELDNPYPTWLVSCFRTALVVAAAALLAVLISWVVGATRVLMMSGIIFGVALIVGGHTIRWAEKCDQKQPER